MIIINEKKELPVAGRIVASKELSKMIEKYEKRADEQGKLIAKQLKETKELIDSA